MDSRLSLDSLLFVGLILVALGGCSSPSTSLERGYTSCGSVTCSPGQYCDEPALSVCEEGCLTDVNCPTGQTCDTAAFFPVCAGASTPDASVPTGDGGSDLLAACRAACEHFQECGLAAGEAARCRTDCDTLTSDQLAAIATCGEEACTAVTSCLGVECLSDAHCGAEQSCLNFTCL